MEGKYTESNMYEKGTTEVHIFQVFQIVYRKLFHMSFDIFRH